jgi:anti-sigma factor (TIGR02949 family)
MALYCSDIDALLQAYLDGELSSHELGDFESHVSGCASCRERTDRESATHARLRRLLAAPPAPSGLRRQILASLDREDAANEAKERRRSWSWVLPAGASLAAAAALALFAFDASRGGPAAVGPEAATVRAAVRDHFHATPVMLGTRGEIQRSAGDFLQVPVRPPRFARPEVALRGWQPTQLDGRAAAKLVYEVTLPSGRHKVELHVLDARDLDLRSSDKRTIGDTDLWVTQTLGFSTVTYKDRRNIGYVFTSDLRLEELVALLADSDLVQLASERLGR